MALASARRVEGSAVEMGLLVEDVWQRRGLGPLLLTSLAVRRENGEVHVEVRL